MAIETVVREAFRPAARPGRIGLELELIPVPRGPDPEAVDPTRLARALAGDPWLMAAGRPSFEPGGQLELSPEPAASVGAAVNLAGALLARSAHAATSVGLDLVAVGIDPCRQLGEVPLWKRTPRYRAMEMLFDRQGDDGRAMMRLTAALQICIDILPGRAGIEQWLVANLAGPPSRDCSPTPRPGA
jgi:glutamate--cysteine ligase